MGLVNRVADLASNQDLSSATPRATANRLDCSPSISAALFQGRRPPVKTNQCALFCCHSTDASFEPFARFAQIGQVTWLSGRPEDAAQCHNAIRFFDLGKSDGLVPRLKLTCEKRASKWHARHIEQRCGDENGSALLVQQRVNQKEYHPTKRQREDRQEFVSHEHSGFGETLLLPAHPRFIRGLPLQCNDLPLHIVGPIAVAGLCLKTLKLPRHDLWVLHSRSGIFGSASGAEGPNPAWADLLIPTISGFFLETANG